jgi:tetratricopeptide (TPR) repeat protein
MNNKLLKISLAVAGLMWCQYCQGKGGDDGQQEPGIRADNASHGQRAAQLTPAQRDECRKAIHSAQLAIQQDPHNAKLYADSASAHYQLGEFGEAIGDYDRALSELRSHESISLWNRGGAHEKLGQNEQALADYSEAINICDKNSIFLCDLYRARSALHKKMGQQEQGLKDAEACASTFQRLVNGGK